MARRRKADSAAGGYLLLLGMVVVISIFVLRLFFTILFYLSVPLFVVTWCATWRSGTPKINGIPEQYDDKEVWAQVKSLASERQEKYRVLDSQYQEGFASGLQTTAKSDDRLFHAGSKFGKHLNNRIEQTYFEIGSLEADINKLRSDVLSKIPDWRSPIIQFTSIKRLHLTSELCLLTLFISYSVLTFTDLLPGDMRESAAKVLVWNPAPDIFQSSLVIAVGLTLIMGGVVWLFGGDRDWKGIDQNTIRDWEALESKWNEEIEREAVFESPKISGKRPMELMRRHAPKRVKQAATTLGTRSSM